MSYLSRNHLVVVGAGLAGVRAVQAARGRGFDGRITLVGAEPEPPYDRPPLSKRFLTDVDPALVPLCDPNRLADDLAVDLRLGAPATALDPAARAVTVAGERLTYDGLVVATGVRARTLSNLPDLAGIHCLRTAADARAVRAAFDHGARVLVVGAGFIGSEVAASARTRGLSVTVVETRPTPLAGPVGTMMGRVLAELHHDHGTDLRCGTKIDAVLGGDRVERVLLSDGGRVDCDVVVVGVGAEPATHWLRSSGLHVTDGLLCGPNLATAAPGVYGAGDAARWPNELFPGTPMRLEHWTNAAEQAAHAVHAWLAPDSAGPFRTVPYFWSDWYDSRVQFVGVAGAATEVVVVHGSPADRRFVALYRQGNRISAALAVNRPAMVMKYRALIAAGATWPAALEFARTH